MSLPPSNVTAVIPTYRHARYIAKTLDSLLTQTQPPRAIIVVNDGSEDDTDGAVAPYLAHIEYLKRPHRGLRFAVAEGLDRVRTDYVHFIASDDWLEPTALEVLSSVLDSHPDVGVSHGWRVIEDGERTRLSGPPLLGKHRDVRMILSGQYVYATPSILWRTEAVLRVQALLKFSYALDYARWMAVVLEGWHYFAVPHVLGHYRRHPDNSSCLANYGGMGQDERRALRFILLHYRQRLSDDERSAIRENFHRHYRELAWKDVADGNRTRARRRFSRQLHLPDGRWNSLAGWGASVLPRSLYLWAKHEQIKISHVSERRSALRSKGN